MCVDNCLGGGQVRRGKGRKGIGCVRDGRRGGGGGGDGRKRGRGKDRRRKNTEFLAGTN